MELSENLIKKLNQLCKKCNDFNKTIIKEFENLSNDIITINLYKNYISEIKPPKYSKSVIRNNNKIFKIYYVENCRDVGRLEKYLKFNKIQTKNKISIQEEQIIINRNNSNFNLLKRFRSYYNSEDNINNNKRKENIICVKEVENKPSVVDKRTSYIQGDNEIREQEPSHRNESLQRVCGEEEKKSDNVKKEKSIVMKIKPVNKEKKEENTNSTLIKSRIKKIIKINSKKHNNIILNKNKAKNIKIIVLKEILSKTCNNRKDTKTLEQEKDPYLSKLRLQRMKSKFRREVMSTTDGKERTYNGLLIRISTYFVEIITELKSQFHNWASRLWTAVLNTVAVLPAWHDAVKRQAAHYP
ncbi:hypothetical protein H8356DRAFT_1417381 [Neocallimastix lanati (nom. inval.)]|nr:hypothetical protein H8356DRAFT_1417381 [Neocallimastix sp. JGI-2020a]